MITPLAVRLTQGADLKRSIQDIVKQHNIQAGSIASCVGCFKQTKIRLAGATEELMLSDPVEIVSLMGTLTPTHQHVHVSVAQVNGQVIGGHMLEGCIIDTTAELIIHVYSDLQFSRLHDSNTGYTELVVDNIQ